MMGNRQVMQEGLFYEFSIERHVPEDHLLRIIDRFVDLADIRLQLKPFYSAKGRPSIDPELMIRMLIAGYCFGIRSERRLCEEVHLNLAYRWYDQYLEGGPEALVDKLSRPKHVWNRIPQKVYDQIIGWGWMYLSTILDDYSRYIIAWKLCTTMKAEDVTDTLKLALKASGCDEAHVLHKPRLLSDNGPSYMAGELADWLGDRKMSHVRGAPFHPQTQGKIERWHQTLKNRILLENYYLPSDLEAQVEAFLEH